MKRLFAKAIVTSALLGGMLVHAADTIKVGGQGMGWLILAGYLIGG